MVEYHREIHEDETLCILFSGGLDSAVAFYYAKKLPFKRVTALFVDIRQPYIEAEAGSVKQFIKKTKSFNDFEILRVSFLDDENYYYKKPTPTEQIIPGRNMTLATLAANYGNTIWVNALLGELKPSMVDKNHTFFKMASETLSYTFGNRVIVESPFWNMTKTDVVKLGLSLGMSSELLTFTSSCYNPRIAHTGKSIQCGACLTCFKRKVAMVNNGIHEIYDTEPFFSDYAMNVFNRHFRSPGYEHSDPIDPSVMETYFTAYDKVGLSFYLLPRYIEERKERKKADAPSEE